MDIKKFKMQIPEYVLAVMNALLRNGFEAYAVGGCVRDSLLGTPPHDFDLTTSAAPEQMKRVFADFTVIETGLKHGTLTVKSEGRNVEVTTFRVDGEYSDHRRPDRVEFTSGTTLPAGILPLTPLHTVLRAVLWMSSEEYTTLKTGLYAVWESPTGALRRTL